MMCAYKNAKNEYYTNGIGFGLNLLGHNSEFEAKDGCGCEEKKLGVMKMLSLINVDIRPW